MKPTISFAIIAKNEEKVIARCLDSIKDLADEIIIVDTGSTDKTKEIAKKYTDKIFDFKWIDDFAAARNYSFSKCECEWIFWIDCDDVIKPEDAKKITNFDYSDKEIILSNYHYSHDEYDNTQLVVPRERIVKRSLGLLWSGEIHEIIPLSAKVYKSDISVHHYKLSSTSERNLKILERIIKKTKSARNFYYLAKEYHDFGRIDEAIRFYKIFVKRRDCWWEDLYQAYYKMAECYKLKKNEIAFKANMFKSLEIEPRRAEPYYSLGQFYVNKQEWNKAIHWYELGYNIKRPDSLWSSYRPDYYTWLPCLNLCICYNAIGNIEKAYEYNKKVLQFRPTDSRAVNNDAILSKAVSAGKHKKDGQQKKLNLGCGDKPIEDYVNVDIEKTDIVDEVFSLDDIPYKDDSISSIYCEHAIEHLPIDDVKVALKEFFRVLQPGGELLLFLPDLELCCENYLKSNNSKIINGIQDKEWYKCCLFGYQKEANGVKKERQFHLSGFSKSEIRQLLEECGFIIDYLENY